MNTKLDCSVKSCTYNCTGKCSLNDIKIGSNGANTSEDTCCSSFRAKSDEDVKNSCGSKKATDCAEIKCDARNCMHNSFGGCAATSIKVETCGCNSDDCSCTQCSTFRM